MKIIVNIIERVDKNFRFGIVRSDKTKAHMCYLYYNKEQDTFFFFFF